MSFSDPSTLGIIACPGAEAFTAQVTKRLAGIYKRRFDRKTASLAARYHLSQELVVRKVNFHNDINSSLTHIPGNVNLYRPPRLLIDTRHTFFANGEVKTEILESIRGKDIYIFQDIENHQPIAFNDGSTLRQLSVNDHIFSLFVTIDAASQAGAGRLNLVIPSYPYARQHKKKGREGLTAARIGKMLEELGVSRIITLDIHSREIENSFSNLRLENLHASFQIIEKLLSIVDIHKEDLVVLAPDTGAVDRNKYYANTLKRPLALLYKERDYSKVTKSAADSNISDMRLLGNVRGKTVFMADDMIGTGGTLIKGMRNLKEMGVSRVISAVSLPFFSGNAIQDFDAAYKEGLFYRIIGTNAVYNPLLSEREWYIQADVTGLFAQIISLIHHDRSLSSMLDNRDVVSQMIQRQMDKKAAAAKADSSAAGSAAVKQESLLEDHDEPIPYGPASLS